MEYLQDILNQIHNLRGTALVIISLIALGYVFKLVPFVPNRYIPAIVILGGAILNPFLISTGEIDYQINHPTLTLALEGFLVGVLAWVLHNKVIGKIMLHLGLEPGQENEPPKPPKP